MCSIIFVLLTAICWGSLFVILVKKPVLNYKERLNFVKVVYALVLLNLFMAAFGDGIWGLSKAMCVVIALISSIPVMLSVVMLKRYFAEKLADGFFKLQITKIDERIWGKLFLDDIHKVLDAELITSSKYYEVGDTVWVDVKNSNFDLPFVTVIVH